MPSASSCAFTTPPRGRLETRVPMPERTHQVWHCYLPDARPGLRYGYRVHGPYAPEQGHRFNPNKLLLDPYAKSIRGELKWSNQHFGYRIGSPRGGSVVRPAQQRRADAALRGDRSRVQLGRRSAAAHAVGRHRDLRAARERVHARAPGRPGAPARDLRGSREPARDRPLAPARRHGGRAHADPRLRRRPASRRARPHELLGLQHDRVLRARDALRGDGPHERSSRRWSAACTRTASR